jgi:hypothetical protein
MMAGNRKNHVPLLGVISGIAILGMASLGQAGGPPPTKPVTPNTPTNNIETPKTPQPSITPTKPAIPKTQPSNQENPAMPLVESGNPNTPKKTTTDQPKSNQPAASTPTPEQKAPIKFPFPAANIKGKNGLVTLDLVNKTPGVIIHQATGVTKETALGSRATNTLPNLALPLNFNYRRQDGGLLLVEVKVIDDGKLQVIFHPTANIDYDTRSLSINKDGGVFLN